MKKKAIVLLMAMLVSIGMMSGCTDKELVNSVESTESVESKGSEEPTGSMESMGAVESLEPIFVPEIDDETLEAQVKIFMDHREDWTIWIDEAKNYDSVAYALNDLNHNGRTELIIACWVGSSNTYDLKIYEINEDGDGYSRLDENDMKKFPENYWDGFYYLENKSGRSRTPVGDLENSVLKGVLTDSYRVYAGKLSNEEFYERYIAINDPGRTCEDLLREALGSWGLCMTDTEGDFTQYEPGDPFYKTLVVSDDRTMILTEDVGTESEYVIKVNLNDHADGMLFGSYVPAKADGKFYDSLLLAIADMDEEGRLVITMDCWKGEEYLAGSTWYFQRVD